MVVGQFRFEVKSVDCDSNVRRHIDGGML